jgi:hypothetical protein
MTALFLDPNKPLATCIAKSCDGCPVRNTLHCHFSPRDLAHFLFISLPVFLLGGAGIYRLGEWFLVPWLVTSIVFFGLIEIRVMCSHCPHYAEQGSALQCWANYGSPKVWKYRPGPMTRAEKAVFWSGLATIFVYPLIFLFAGMQWFLLIAYSLWSAGSTMMLRAHMCSQCMNFACPLNGVKDAVRQDFLDRNPIVAKVWSTSNR